MQYTIGFSPALKTGSGYAAVRKNMSIVELSNSKAKQSSLCCSRPTNPPLGHCHATEPTHFFHRRADHPPRFTIIALVPLFWITRLIVVSPQILLSPARLSRASKPLLLFPLLLSKTLSSRFDHTCTVVPACKNRPTTSEVNEIGVL